jgi:hypothetical protein
LGLMFSSSIGVQLIYKGFVQLLCYPTEFSTQQMQHTWSASLIANKQFNLHFDRNVLILAFDC